MDAAASNCSMPIIQGSLPNEEVRRDASPTTAPNLCYLWLLFSPAFLLLNADNRGNWGGAGTALMLCAARDKDCRIVGDRSNHRSQRRPGVSLVIDIGVGQHRGAPASNSTVRTGVRLGENPGYALGILRRERAREFQARVC